MLRRFYLHFMMLVAVFSSTVSVKAQDNSLIPAAGQKVYVPLSAKSVKGKMTVSSYSRNTINNFDYTLSFNGKELYSKHYVFPEPLGGYDNAIVEIDVPPYTELGEDNLLFTITKVNGERNNATIGYANVPRVTVTKVPKRKVVVEEYTGMWCGYCPRGIALMENLAHTFGNEFIGIAVHTYDALHCLDYSEKASEDRSRPLLWMNRSRKLTYIVAADEFKAEQAAGADMDIEVSAMWDKEKNNITVTPNVIFRVNREEAPYGFAYVLTEDGMSNPRWYQNNNHRGDIQYRGVSKEFDYFIDAPGEIYNLENNFVAIAAEGVKTAKTDLLKAPIKADEVLSHTYVFKNIKSQGKIQDKSKLSVCVLLINLNTGHIENAAKCSISEFSATAISPISEGSRTAVETARYTLDGRRIMAPQKGINIVKYSDGRVSKEVVTN